MITLAHVDRFRFLLLLNSERNCRRSWI